MQVCKYVSMQVCSYMQRFSKHSLLYSNLLYPTYPTNKSEAIYMSAVAAFFNSKYKTKVAHLDFFKNTADFNS